MKNNCIKFGLLIIILMSLQLVGCTSKEKYYSDVTQARDTAYQKWKSRKENPDQAQTIINGQLNIEDCIKLTLVNNKNLQKIVEEKNIAKAGEIKAFSGMLPTVTFSGSYIRKDEVASLGFITFGSLNNYSFGLNVVQPIFAGGSIIAGINSARLATLLTDQSVRKAFQDVIYSANHSYYDVLLNQQLFDISVAAVESAQARLDSVKTKRKLGVASEYDVLRAEVELANQKSEYIKNKNNIDLARTSLLKVMGVSQDSNIVLSEGLVFNPVDVNMENAVETAFKNRPDLFGHEFNVRIQKEFVNIAKSRYFPFINSSFNETWAKPDPHRATLVQWGHAWQAGISGAWTLFDGFSREGEMIEQKARLKQSEISLTNAEETALFELAKAKWVIDNAAQAVESQKFNVSQAEESLRLADLGYKEGINTQLETIDAQSALTKAKSFYYQAIYAHIIAKLDLYQSLGILAGKAPEPDYMEKSEQNKSAEKKPSPKSGQEKK